jgi:hypothetical protein
MKVLVFYRPDSEHARKTEEFMRELLRQHDLSPKQIETVSIDTREGASLASLYDILSYPGVVVVDNYGAYIKSWSGDLPLMDEVMSYAFSFGGA